MTKYDIRTGVTKIKTKTAIAISAITFAVGGLGFAVAIPAASHAASNDYCGSSANGCAHSSSNTICSGHGAFGAFGPGNDWSGGASGDHTAYNNSTLCGNPQGSAGVYGDHSN